jgi:hypothetical protein
VKIHRIKLTNYRGIQQLEHVLKPVGITILEGPNESGKSCFIEALDNLFDYPNDSHAQEIRDIQPEGQDVGPQVEAEIEVGPYHFTYRKKWIRNVETVLDISQPRPERVVGRDAHDRALSILSEELDIDLYKALRITQGTGFDQPKLPTESSLTRALDAAAGGTPISDREASLVARAEEEYRRYWTGGARVRDLVRAADQAAVEAEARVAEFEGKEREADGDMSRHEELTRRLVELAAQVDPLEARAREHEARLNEVRQREEALRTLEAEAQGAQAAARLATQAREARANLVSEVDRLRKAEAAAKADFDENAHIAESAISAAATAREVAESTETAAMEARSLARIRFDDSSAHQTEFQLVLLKERRQKVSGATTAKHAAEKTLAGNRITEEVLQIIHRADQKSAVTAAKLNAASPTLRMQARRALNVRLDGKEVQLGPTKQHEQTVPRTVKIEVGDVRLEMRPGTSLDDLQEAYKNAQQELRDLLTEYSLTSTSEAPQARSARQDAEQAKVRADADIREALRSDKALPFKNIEEMDTKIQELEGRIVQLKAGRPPRPAPAPNREEAKRLAEVAQSAVDKCERAARDARAAADGATSEASKLAEAQAARTARLGAATDAFRTADSRLEAAREGLPDSDVQTTAEAAQIAAEAAIQAHTTAKRDLERADPETLNARASTARAAVRRVETEIDDIASEQHTAGGRLQVHAQAGIHARLERAYADLDATRAEAHSLHRRAEAAKTLFEALVSHRSAAQRRYIGPLRDHLLRLGRLVYDETFDVELDESLSVTHRSLHGTRLPYRSLSKGAKEQISLLLRLACALVVSHDGTGVPVLLDDALGYTDPRRLEGMGVVLDRAGRDSQILLMTCTPDRYQAVSSAVVRRM